jgi:hypothetical protein
MDSEMALIDCNECGKQISDKAQHCVHCGVAIEQHADANAKQKNSSLASNESNASMVFSDANKPGSTLPTTLSLLKYTVAAAIILHIIFVFLGKPMYNDSAVLGTLYGNGIFISPIAFTLIIAIVTSAITVTMLKTKNSALRFASAVIYLVFSFSSFQEFIRFHRIGLFLQETNESIAIPLAPFALLITVLQVLCAVYLFLPPSSKYFKNSPAA